MYSQLVFYFFNILWRDASCMLYGMNQSEGCYNGMNQSEGCYNGMNQSKGCYYVSLRGRAHEPRRQYTYNIGVYSIL